MPRFARLALHMPGFGGLATFDALTLQQVSMLIDEVDDELRRKAKAWKK